MPPATPETSPDVPVDPWGWAGESDEGEPEAVADPATVTAVMVVRDAEEWLPAQLRALAELDPRPGRIVVVDNGSADDGPRLLAEAAAAGVVDEVLPGEPGWGFGEAVGRALGDDDPDWLWLLHDDSAPRPDALGQLLLGAARTGAAIVVPKLLLPPRRNYPDAIAEIGQGITRGGLRVGLVDEGDIDQHQEAPAPVLGGSTAGMLVDGAVWRELGGLAPELPGHRDGVDLGWRAHDVGHDVTTWPDAALVHRRAGRLGERAPGSGPGGHEADRLAALRVAAARGPAPATTAALTAASWLRAAGFLLAKSPRLARAELRALGTFRATPEATAALRARSEPAPAEDLAEVLPGRFWALRHALDELGGAVAERYRDAAAGSDAATSLDELTGDDFAGGRRGRVRVSGRLVLVVVLLLAALGAARTLWPGSVAGGGILPAPADAGAAWSAYLTPLAGVPGANAPWLGVGAALAALTPGGPDVFVVVALLACPLLAALAAHALARTLGRGRGVAALAGGLWAAAVLLLGLVTAGDVSGMALAVAGPLLARDVARMIAGTAAGAERLRAPAGAAIWLLVAAAFWPAALLVATIGGVVWLIRDRSRWPELLVACGVPWLFLVPWLPTLARWPGRVLTGADPLAWPAWSQAASATLAGRILPSGLPLFVNVVFFAVLGAAALAGLARIGQARTRALLALAIGAPLIVGVALSRLSLQVDGGQSRALLSGWALLVASALITAALWPPTAAGEEYPGRPVRGAAAWLGAALATAGLLGIGAFGVVGFAGPVRPSPSLLPGYVADVVASPRATRVLMIDRPAAGELAWNVVDAAQPTWGSGERNPAGDFATEFAGLVQAISGPGVPDDLADRLASLAVGHVWMRGFDDEALAALGNSGGLARAETGDGAVVWTVRGSVSRAAVVAGGAVAPVTDGVVPPGTGIRWLQLTEEPDGRRRAEVGGVPLRPAPDRPPVTYELPDGVHGRLETGLPPAWPALAWQLLLVVGLLVLAAPTIQGGSVARRGAE